MTPEQIKIAADALTAIMETSGWGLLDLRDALAGNIYSEEDFGEIRDYLHSLKK